MRLAKSFSISLKNVCHISRGIRGVWIRFSLYTFFLLVISKLYVPLLSQTH